MPSSPPARSCPRVAHDASRALGAPVAVWSGVRLDRAFAEVRG